MSRWTWDEVGEAYCDYCGDPYETWVSDYEKEQHHLCSECETIRHTQNLMEVDYDEDIS